MEEIEFRPALWCMTFAGQQDGTPDSSRGGRTAGGAREFVLPNMSTGELVNLIRRKAG